MILDDLDQISTKSTSGRAWQMYQAIMIDKHDITILGSNCPLPLCRALGFSYSTVCCIVHWVPSPRERIRQLGLEQRKLQPSRPSKPDASPRFESQVSALQELTHHSRSKKRKGTGSNSSSSRRSRGNKFIKHLMNTVVKVVILVQKYYTLQQ